MTPASPLSRLEKLAAEHCQTDEPFVTADFIAGGRAMLRILLEPGEDYKPRGYVSLRKEDGGLTHIILWEKYDDQPSIPYCDLRELLQARASLEGTKKQADYLQMRCSANEDAEIPALQKQLAASEARVRSLTTVLQWIAEQPNRLGEKADGAPAYVQQCWVKADHALQEVQR